MAYKMKGSPAKLGTIQGTSGHSSALKQNKKVRSSEIKAKKKEGELSAADLALLKSQTEYTNLERTNKEEAEQRAKDSEDKAKKEAKEATKEKVRAYKQSSGKGKGEKYDVSTDEYEALDDDAKDWITKKNRKVQGKMDKEVGDAKTESSFNVMDALGGYLSSGGGKEGLGAAFGAGFSKKSPNELLAMQKAREARNKKDGGDVLQENDGQESENEGETEDTVQGRAAKNFLKES